MMDKNVGGIDRRLRITLGAVIVLLGFFFQSWWGAVGVVAIITGALGWCPAYIPFGFSSCSGKK